MRRTPVRAGLAVITSLTVLGLTGLGLAACSPAGPGTTAPSAVAPGLAAAVSSPHEDSVYPHAGDPGVDALHYALELTWEPSTGLLDGVEELTFRATADADEVRLDLGEALEPTDVRLDGEPVDVTHEGASLVVEGPVTADAQHVLSLAYAGRPVPVRAPAQRRDQTTIGLHVTPEGELWTMQEPYGAFTWYAVNDQPADKALYDITVHAPAPMTGVANGELLSRRTTDGVTTTRWRLDEPAAAYLTTLAVGAYDLTRDRHGEVPLTYWTPRDRPGLVARLDDTPELLGWVEERLGAYPFGTLGLVVVDSESAMETQTMVTLGDTDYATSPGTILHELVHQWYGDQVTPADWRDLWMNEGMATYLESLWHGERAACERCEVAAWRALDQGWRDEAGPPGDYDPRQFAAATVYYSAALMWDAFRDLVGDETFWRVTREWPAYAAAEHAGTADRETWVAWLERETGEELSDFFTAWLTSPTTPR